MTSSAFFSSAFISPAFPLGPRRLQSAPPSSCAPVVNRPSSCKQPIHSVQSPNQASSYLLYTVTPLLLINPLSTLAQTVQSPDPTKAAVDPTQVTQAQLDDSLSSRILAFTALTLLIIASTGAIVLSFNNFIISRDDKKHRQWVQDRIDGRPVPKNRWSPDIDTTFPLRNPTGASSEKGMNREMRRMQKRMQEKEDREKKRKEKIAKDRADANGEN